MADRALRQEDARFWRALPWAVLAWLVSLWLVGRLLASPRVDNAAPAPVEARIVELPDTPPAARAENTPPPPKQALPPPPIPQPQLAPAAPPPPVAKAEPAPPAPPAAAPPPPVALAPKAVAGVDTHGAQAIKQVQVELSDALADTVAGQNTTVLFHIAADGSVTAVDLDPPSSNPAVNRIVRDTLMRWQFAPAVTAGKPMASTLKLNVPLDGQ